MPKVMDLEIRDTEEHDTAVISRAQSIDKKHFITAFYVKTTVYWNNNLNKEVTLQIKASPNGTKYFKVGEPITIPVNDEDYTIISEGHPHIKGTVKASEPPTTGAIKIWIEVS